MQENVLLYEDSGTLPENKKVLQVNACTVQEIALSTKEKR